MPWQLERERKPFRERLLNWVSTLAIIVLAVIALWGMAQEALLLMGDYR